MTARARASRRPTASSQQAVLRGRACRRDARLRPSDVDFVECHGTGTALGDPIEVHALDAVYGAPRQPGAAPLWVGAVKANLGHLESCAGIAGVLRVLASFPRQALTASPRCGPQNPHVDWGRLRLKVVDAPTPWPSRPERPRRAGVSAFGLSGTNAHVVIEEPPEPAMPVLDAAADPLPAFPLLLSGQGHAALRAQAERWAGWMREHPGAGWREVVRTAALRRTHFEARAAVHTNGVQAAAEALAALANGRSHPAVWVGEARERAGLVFVFPGQGGQWPGMGRALLRESAAFADVVAACDRALRPHTGESVIAALDGADPTSLERVEILQPVLFAMSVGLAAAWRSLGVVPSAVVGSSQGEVAAAVVAGALTIEEGALVVAARSRLTRGLVDTGGMAAVELPPHEVERMLREAWPTLSIGVVLGPTSTVVSGDTGAIGRMGDEHGGAGRLLPPPGRRLRVA